MKKILATVAGLLMATTAHAQTTGSVAVGTDYIARGTSQTYNKPGAVVYVEHQFKDGIYIGGILANIDFDDGTKAEADVVGGYRFKSGKVNLEVGGIYITYHGTQTTNWNMGEVHVAANRTFGKVTVGAYAGYSPDYFNYGGPSTYTELNASLPVSKKLSVSGAVAYQYIKRDIDYSTWNAGATYSLTPTLSVDARYYGTDWKPVGNRYIDGIYRDRVVLTLKKVF